MDGIMFYFFIVLYTTLSQSGFTRNPLMSLTEGNSAAKKLPETKKKQREDARLPKNIRTNSIIA